MARRVVVDPVTRSEGHLRIEAMLDDRGVVHDAISSGTMWRGLEVILKGRDPREAWAFCERICGVCTTVHALASVRSVENALHIEVPPNAERIRNMMALTQMIQDHVVHFYHLHALDWVDVISALKADPAATAALAQTVSPDWPTSSPGYFRQTQGTLKKFAESNQLGIFANAYWGHPAYKLPPEANLMAVAHYLEALEWQKEIVKIHTIFGGKNPHPNYLVGGTACAISFEGDHAANMAQLSMVRDLIAQARRIVEGLYVPDLLAVASFYPEWTKIGGGLGNYMSYGDIPRNGIGDPQQYRFPRGVIVGRDLTHVLPVDPADPEQVREEVAHSWYDYPQGMEALHPWDGVTEAHYTGPRQHYRQLDENAKYSWLKAPRWRGRAMEVGPLARVLIGYASGRGDFKDVVTEALGRLKLPPEALFSTVGRTAARGLETRLAVQWLSEEYDRLIANIKSGDTATANAKLWDPTTWPAEAKGYGFSEAPRGALGHWVHIKEGKIENYQIVVPSTWNASPKDGKGQHGAYEAALLDTPVADAERPVEILRTVHSFDPCLACATHVFDPQGRKLSEVAVC